MNDKAPTPDMVLYLKRSSTEGIAVAVAVAVAVAIAAAAVAAWVHLDLPSPREHLDTIQCQAAAPTIRGTRPQVCCPGIRAQGGRQEGVIGRLTRGHLSSNLWKKKKRGHREINSVSTKVFVVIDLVGNDS